MLLSNLWTKCSNAIIAIRYDKASKSTYMYVYFIKNVIKKTTLNNNMTP